ncbi:hypothetical protein CONPUDRAFT_153671 [Coniophora puteana RWD-64-598 SS2]|uniref:Uncharacterized protein n=1 Tax=Coniophora puteana (strain RWD-64-598) TaxID=741705 RepID=A0A5M3MPK4_CONPW|nr:uncharacterized protein CONPUDRAFT_153671 [Coniophora puteana RWD-64-598 SS2]EIW81122.1 hypothetical protein CONPUDRAFT_153671 [Coniophora puteana RWD-64-598 SS2]
MDPVFWTTLSVNLNGPFIPSIITKFFTAVGKNPFNVTVTSGDTSSPELSATKEHARLTVLMKQLDPHLGAKVLKSLRLDIIYRSSILLALSYLGEKELFCLSDLRLNSYVADTEEEATVFQLMFPELTSLHIDAKTFVDIVMEGVEWPQLPGMGIHPFALVVTRYRPREEDLLSIDGFVDALDFFISEIPFLTLRISDVGFDPSSGCDIDGCIVRPSALVSLADLEGPIIQALFSIIEYRPSDMAAFQGGDTAVLTRCEVATETEIWCDFLRLEEIDSSSSIINALENWSPHNPMGYTTLMVDKCSGFDDSVLEWMVEEEDRFARLKKIAVTKPAFSAETLHELAEVLLDEALSEIQVWDGPPLDEEIRDRFAELEKLKFSWKV